MKKTLMSGWVAMALCGLVLSAAAAPATVVTQPVPVAVACGGCKVADTVPVAGDTQMVTTVVAVGMPVHQVRGTGQVDQARTPEAGLVLAFGTRPAPHANPRPLAPPGG